MLMIDIETLSNRPGPVIVQIGWAYAPSLSAGITGSGCINVDPVTCRALGGGITLSTIEWWITKGGAKAYKTTLKNRQTIEQALTVLDVVFKKHKPSTVWGNSPSFDMAALRFYYSKLKRDVPWAFRAERDYRTLRELYGRTSDMPKTTTTHNGEADARWQLEHLIGIMEFINA